MMRRLAFFAAPLLLAGVVAAQESRQVPPLPETPEASPDGPDAPTQEPETPKIQIRISEIPGLKLTYLTIPWGPQTFATMEAPHDGFYNTRAWAFARLENTEALKFDGQEMAPGNYALVFHPNDTSNRGMSLEVKSIEPGEFLKPGNALGATPVGKTLFEQPLRFDIADGVAPTLTVSIGPGTKGFSLTVQYGDRRFVRDIEM